MSQMKTGDYFYYKDVELERIGKVTEVDSTGCVIEWSYFSPPYTSSNVRYTFKFLEIWIKEGNVKPFFPLVEIIE